MNTIRALTAVGAFALLLTGGCYSVEPIASVTPVSGTRLSLAINDRGRVALGGSMGPSIRVVEGRLLSQQDTTYVLSMIGVNYLDGTFQKWAGETVQINSGMVGGFFEKRFSPARTLLFVAGTTAAGFLVTRGYKFLQGPNDDPLPPPPPEIEGRFALPFRIRLTR